MYANGISLLANLKKIVLRAIAKEIISTDPFKLFKGKKTKLKKKPLTRAALNLIENKEFSSERLSTIRDIFVFQCYTGLNEYLREIKELCSVRDLAISGPLNAHRARRTFASTVTLNNGVPIHVVKEMLGHHSVKQTEEYAIPEQEAISKEMTELRGKLSNEKQSEKPDIIGIKAEIA